MQTSGRTGPAASLDPNTLTVENPTHDDENQRWRFRTSEVSRQLLLNSFPHLTLTTKQKTRFQGCGTDAWIEHSPSTGKVRVHSNRCNHRWCPACARSRGFHVREWIKQAVQKGTEKSWKFLTLTYKHDRKPLVEQLANLKESFRRLRQRKAWKARITGGMAIIEIKRNHTTGQWHPHIHIVARGKYFPQKLLSTEWLNATKHSKIVDIKQIKDAEGAGEYLAKYLTKPIDSSLFNEPQVIREFMETITKCRLLIRFGDVPGYDDDQEKEDYPKDWKKICPLASALAERRAGNPYYVALLDKLENTCDDPFNPDDFEQDTPPMPPMQSNTG